MNILTSSLEFVSLLMAGVVVPDIPIPVSATDSIVQILDTRSATCSPKRIKSILYGYMGERSTGTITYQ